MLILSSPLKGVVEWFRQNQFVFLKGKSVWMLNAQYFSLFMLVKFENGVIIMSDKSENTNLLPEEKKLGNAAERNSYTEY